jgi:hypothetical protein
MHIFQLKGFKSYLAFLTAVLLLVASVLALPAFLMQITWNAIILETFNGPEISLIQGFLLWGIMLILFKLLFNPEINFEFKALSPSQFDQKMQDLKSKSKKPKK